MYIKISEIFKIKIHIFYKIYPYTVLSELMR